MRCAAFGGSGRSSAFGRLHSSGPRILLCVASAVFGRTLLRGARGTAHDARRMPRVAQCAVHAVRREGSMVDRAAPHSTPPLYVALADRPIRLRECRSAHIGAGTRPRRRRDSATSAPGLLANVQHVVMPLRLSLCVWSKTLRWTMPWFSCLCVPATSASGLSSPLPRLRAGTGAHACHICTGTGLTPATSAPGLGSPPPHLRRDWAHPSHMWTAAAAAAAASARLPRIYGPESLELIAHARRGR